MRTTCACYTVAWLAGVDWQARVATGVTALCPPGIEIPQDRSCVLVTGKDNHGA
jgi:hypothetical protein